MNKFLLSCESTVDMPYSHFANRNVEILFYTYEINGDIFEDDMCRHENAVGEFYEKLKNGALPNTSQINQFTYIEFFTRQLEKGDVLHICFGSGMSKSINNALAAAEIVKKDFPNRKIIVIDSLCSSSGYGMLAEMAADLRDEGKSLEEAAKIIEATKPKIHHQFFSTDLKYFRRGGRVSGVAATVGTVLNICPIMHLNEKGCIIAYNKVRGKKNAIAFTVKEMLKTAENGAEYSGRCFISHSNCIEDAKATAEAIKASFPNIKEIEIFDIGTIIASHTGPGTVAVYYVGTDR